ncbi:MAG: large conductance mechanosensitive channel protein MscL [Lachnospiraceae bacterium]|nr:large conductance mechanosensitive channel protein MscL [Lachnospiraceae bacterium]
MLKEFKKFALRGNMVDLAVGIIIGGAFTGIVNSFVNNIIMPLLSVFTNKINFSNLFIALDGKHYDSLELAQKAKVATINYGQFLTGVIDFIIMAFVVFLIVQWLNKLRKKEEPVVTTKKCPYCMSDIHIEATKCPHCTGEISL